jgi:hypothetical protein
LFDRLRNTENVQRGVLPHHYATRVAWTYRSGLGDVNDLMSASSWSGSYGLSAALELRNIAFHEAAPPTTIR